MITNTYPHPCCCPQPAAAELTAACSGLAAAFSKHKKSGSYSIHVRVDDRVDTLQP